MVNPIDPAHTALFVMDMQVDAVGEHGASAEAGAWRHEKQPERHRPHPGAAGGGACGRRAVVHVHHVVDGRDGPANAPLFTLVEGGGFLALAGRPGRAGPRAGGGRSGGPQVPCERLPRQRPGDQARQPRRHLMTGTWTNFSVESTCRYGADAGYAMVLVADATCSMDADWQSAVDRLRPHPARRDGRDGDGGRPRRVVTGPPGRAAQRAVGRQAHRLQPVRLDD